MEDLDPIAVYAYSRQEYAYIAIRDAHTPLQQDPNLHLQIETAKKSNT